MPGALNVWAAELPALHARANAAGKKMRPADAEKGVLHKALRAGDVVKCQELLNAGVGANDEEEVQVNPLPVLIITSRLTCPLLPTTALLTASAPCPCIRMA